MTADSPILKRGKQALSEAFSVPRGDRSRIVSASEVRSGQKHLLTVLARLPHDRDGWCVGSGKFLGTELGVDEDTVYRRAAALEAKGLLVVHRKPPYWANRFRVRYDLLSPVPVRPLAVSNDPHSVGVSHPANHPQIALGSPAEVRMDTRNLRDDPRPSENESKTPTAGGGDSSSRKMKRTAPSQGPLMDDQREGARLLKQAGINVVPPETLARQHSLSEIKAVIAEGKRVFCDAKTAPGWIVNMLRGGSGETLAKNAEVKRARARETPIRPQRPPVAPLAPEIIADQQKRQAEALERNAAERAEDDRLKRLVADPAHQAEVRMVFDAFLAEAPETARPLIKIRLERGLWQTESGLRERLRALLTEVPMTNPMPLTEPAPRQSATAT